MLSALSRNWWSTVLRGVAALALGLLAWARPELFWGSLVLVIGVYAFVDGAFAVAAAVRAQSGSRWSHLLEGVVGIALGVFAFVYPGATGTAIVVAIGVWAVATGMLEIASAVRLREEIDDEILLAIGGVVSTALGVALLARPRFGEVITTYLLGTYGIVFGVILVLLGFRLRGFKAGNTLRP